MNGIKGPVMIHNDDKDVVISIKSKRSATVIAYQLAQCSIHLCSSMLSVFFLLMIFQPMDQIYGTIASQPMVAVACCMLVFTYLLLWTAFSFNKYTCKVFNQSLSYSNNSAWYIIPMGSITGVSVQRSLLQRLCGIHTVCIKNSIDLPNIVMGYLTAHQATKLSGEIKRLSELTPSGSDNAVQHGSQNILSRFCLDSTASVLIYIFLKKYFFLSFIFLIWAAGVTAILSFVLLALAGSYIFGLSDALYAYISVVATMSGYVVLNTWRSARASYTIKPGMVINDYAHHPGLYSPSLEVISAKDITDVNATRSWLDCVFDRTTVSIHHKNSPKERSGLHYLFVPDRLKKQQVPSVFVGLNEQQADDFSQAISRMRADTIVTGAATQNHKTSKNNTGKERPGTVIHSFNLRNNDVHVIYVFINAITAQPALYSIFTVICIIPGFLGIFQTYVIWMLPFIMLWMKCKKEANNNRCYTVSQACVRIKMKGKTGIIPLEYTHNIHVKRTLADKLCGYFTVVISTASIDDPTREAIGSLLPGFNITRKIGRSFIGDSDKVLCYGLTKTQAKSFLETVVILIAQQRH